MGKALKQRRNWVQKPFVVRRSPEARRSALRGYAETRYAAKSWTWERRVAARIEAKESDEDEHLYATVYCARG
jgi:hypothetical protein